MKTTLVIASVLLFSASAFAQTNDRPLVAGTDWSKTGQYLCDDRPSVRGYEPKPLKCPSF